jgi:glucose/arabinose dehydrogenase
MPPGMMPPPVTPPEPPAAEPPACQDADAKLNGLRLVTVATASSPIHLVGHKSDPDTALIAERGGTIRVAKGLRNATTAVELSAPIRIAQTTTGGERGLLSIALHPDDPAKLYAFYNGMGNNDTVVQEFARNLESGMVTPGKELYRSSHSASNHQGGQVAFGADKMLYFSVGDNAQGGGAAGNLGGPYGKIFRIDPATGMAPPGNRMGLMWSYGLRNPFRMSFDRKTGDLYIGDVGEGTEEVNFQAAGKSGINYGWSGGGAGEGAPIVRYTRQNQFAVIGGYVYRGTKNGCMHGRYFFADRGRGPTRSVVVQNGSVMGGERSHAGLSNAGIYSFGEDGAGEVYMLYGSGGNAGRVARIVE